jgi:hypothetical protein
MRWLDSLEHDRAIRTRTNTFGAGGLCENRMAELPACEASAVTPQFEQFRSAPLGVPWNGHRVFPHRLSGESPISAHAQRAHCLRFQRHRSENGRARNDHVLSPKEYRDFAAQCLRWAARAKREEHKNMMLQMADHWMQTAQTLERVDTCVPSGARLASTPTPQDDARQKPLQDDFKGASR